LVASVIVPAFPGAAVAKAELVAHAVVPTVAVFLPLRIGPHPMVVVVPTLEGWLVLQEVLSAVGSVGPRLTMGCPIFWA
jgi:hypothetical protein